MRTEQVGGRTLRHVVKMPFTGTLFRGDSEKNHRVHKGKEFLQMPPRTSVRAQTTNDSLAQARALAVSGNEVSHEETQNLRIVPNLSMRPQTGIRANKVIKIVDTTPEANVIIPARNFQYINAHVSKNSAAILPRKIVSKDAVLHRGIGDERQTMSDSTRTRNA
ncbi:hypothetical protein M951_chr3181 (nucleomorph) [Lotharella oceanica]|uniref:Uncharacterized protein n=1 Tax=Lotharella oceanica TaxID=641309 RepID=A0A060DBQ8_9EUKA|nr:hypothetical protein M951_chr124 [Lotharella oceanica]AIB09686.1 hypothetical protein M951_chr1207 [Lotharella oceanica]AIB09727.1 hypothetical protein M951_chr224 [Lotharella oceanica]AIB09889.1 hypothetical protein M951_chr2197 [Lotharella oceanica]AIB09930.1 hypothetical protein M951_chr324 [Lotharella oceanica]